ncbi:MAG TPA: ribonuclease HI [Anaerolineaceae bacterium]|nr:ribonuclease HI [Anaerolineaceae bacterium]
MTAQPAKPDQRFTNSIVTLYTDGACSGNPGPGGYAALLKYKGQQRTLSGGFNQTTNNRMELMAVIAGLEALTRPCRVQVFTDSQYVAQAMQQGWARRWRANNWMRNRKEPALNSDLWERLLRLCETHRVEFTWVRGHASDPDNAACDRLAVAAAAQPNLPPDPGFKIEPARYNQ